MNNYDYKIGKLNGILEAFQWVNSKTNYGYDFTIEILSGNDDLKKLATDHLKHLYPNATVHSKPIENWRDEFSKKLQEWLFEYIQIDIDPLNSHNKLQHINSGFTLFDIKSREHFINNFCDDLEDALGVVEVISVNIETDEWYEAYWHDFAFKGKNGAVFIHLGVSD
ncbi:MAG: hypothetical protein L0G41_03020 [Psychrobacter sp.]|uniref:Uncharacterized protein n=1 Tax=Psychrobacter piscatorii TaxID=554343 RepID=A0A0T6DR39_9GAMM|nr:hypothetical protein [Psychrobacter piscatorii]KRU22425.1 hypothetical protein AS194_08580 [Psychrobacter piscatorii]MDN5665183.1 hypothetical protein [Psychrobacter sp.]